MELLDGVDLRQWLASSRALEVQLRVMLDLCSAVSYAHSCGVLHRDIKPGNVQVLPDGHAKLMDFGIALSEVSDLTASGTVMGTPVYIAPEILNNQPPSVASDIYAVGMICYEMLTGENPFIGTSLAACINLILTATPRHLHERRPDLPMELADAVMQLVDKDPFARGGGLQRLTAALISALGSVPHATAPPGADSQATTALRTSRGPDPGPKPNRRRTVVIVATVALALLTVVTVGILSTTGGNRADSDPPDARRSASRTPPPEPADAGADGATVVREPTRSVPSDSGVQVPEQHSQVGVDLTGHTSGPGVARTATSTPIPTAAPTAVPTAAPTTAPTDAPADANRIASLRNDDLGSAGPTVTRDASPASPTPRSTPAADAIPSPRVVPAPPNPSPLPTAAAFDLAAVDPRFIRLGAQARLRLSGSGFHDGMTVVVLRGRREAVGFHLSRIEVVDPGHAELDVVVDQSTAPGNYSVVAVGADGRRSNRIELDVNL
jgi:serine/threonine-protein kinase